MFRLAQEPQEQEPQEPQAQGPLELRALEGLKAPALEQQARARAPALERAQGQVPPASCPRRRCCTR